MSAINAIGDVDVGRGTLLGRLSSVERVSYGALLGLEDSGALVWDTDQNLMYTWSGVTWLAIARQVFGPMTRAAAVAASWAPGQFPVIIRVSDYTVGVSPTVPREADVLFTAAPTASFDGSNEVPLSGFTLDNNGEWADQITPFPPSTSNIANIAARLSHASIHGNSGPISNGADEASQLWLPPQGIIASYTLSREAVQAGGQIVEFFPAWRTGQVTRLNLTAMGDRGGPPGSTFTFEFDYESPGNTFLANPIVLDESTRTGNRNGLSSFSTGFAGNPGFIRNGGFLIVTVTPTQGATVTAGVQFTLYGYDLESTQPRS